jgi:pimeloyl-ACP methyl ester carboxylesterase
MGQRLKNTNMSTSHRPSTTEQITIRGLRYGIRHWGDPEAPLVFFLHGWMDSSATFQFVVDALKRSWHVIAPDWRGYGQSEWLSRPYWFPDYYADLHEILAHYSQSPMRLVGHSMGANVASTYAGLRPERVSQLVMMDFLGLAIPSDTDGSRQLNQWLTAVQAAPEMRAYKSHEALARRLLSVNHRLTKERADFLSRSVSCLRPDGLVAMACDPWHKVPSPTLYRVEDSMASWQCITAPVLMLVADQGFVHQRFANNPEELRHRLDCFKDRKVVTIADAGHNIQHDQPERVAAALEQFLMR